MSDRIAFRPLASLETTLDPSISSRARTLYQSAKTRTAKGSGNDLDKGLAGNSIAIAAACLLLAKTESEGASAEDMDDYQRNSMATKPQFKQIVSLLQSVLDLRTSAKTAFTPTGGSARKRKSEANDEIEEPVTPSKSARGKQPAKTHTPSEDRPSTPTRTSVRKSARVSSAVEALTTASHQKRRAEKDEELSVPTRTTRSAPRKSAPGSKQEADSIRTPTKSTAAKDKGKQKATEAFEKAIAQTTPSKTKSILKATPVKPAIDYTKPFVALQSEANGKEKQEDDVPRENYWGDLLIRYRRKEDLDVRRQKTERWRQSMLKKLEAAM